MKNKTRILFDTQHDWEYYDAVRNRLIAEKTNEFWGEVKVTREEVYDEIYTIHDAEWENFKRAFENANDFGFIIAGRAQRWNGYYSGIRHIKDFDDLRDFLSCYDDIIITEENGHLYIGGYHHDGCDSFEIKALTKYTVIAPCCDYYAWEDEEFMSKIFNCNFYTKLPRISMYY